MRLTNEMRYNVAKKVVMEIYESKVKNLILLIREDATRIIEKNLPTEFIDLAEKLDNKKNYCRYFSYSDNVNIHGINSRCNINEFTEPTFNGSIKSLGNNPLRSYLHTFHDRTYTAVSKRRAPSGNHWASYQNVKLTKTFPQPSDGYKMEKGYNWTSTVTLIKDLMKVLKECENLFSEIYEFLLQFSTYKKAEKEWPDLSRYLTFIQPEGSGNKVSTALVKSGMTVRRSINKARQEVIGV